MEMKMSQLDPKDIDDLFINGVNSVHFEIMSNQHGILIIHTPKESYGFDIGSKDGKHHIHMRRNF